PFAHFDAARHVDLTHSAPSRPGRLPGAAPPSCHAMRGVAMNWSEEGIVLAAREHGESAAILSLLTEAHGRHLGLVRGAKGPRARARSEPGNRVAASWRGRLDEHLGSYSCEVISAPAARWLDDPLRLDALAAATALVDRVLPEREP